MKRLFFLLIVVVASVLPQSVWAGAVLSGTTLTITSDAAGSLASGTISLDGVTNKAAVKTIVLDGYFNESDLSKISSAQGFTDVTDVDMYNAHFVKAKSGTTPTSYKWFKVDPPTGSAGTEAQAYTGGKLYKLVYPRKWNESSTPWDPTTPVTRYASVDAMNADATGTVGRYGKTPKYVYCQMIITYQDWTALGVTLGDNTVYDYVDWLANDLSAHASEYQNNDVIRLREYYQVIKKDESGGDEQSNLQWSGVVYPTDEQLAAAWDAKKVHVAEWVGAKYGSLVINEFTRLGDYIQFDVYYKKVDSRSWGSPQTSGTEPIESDFEYADREANKRYANGAWVRMIDYDYYQLALDNENTTGRSWVEVTTLNSVNNAKYHFDDINGEAAIDAKSTGNDGDYAIEGGAGYAYTGSEWVTLAAWAGVTTVSDYSQMKFSYWKGSLVTATTSRYANESVSSEIFQECQSITHINFMGGNVIGLHDRATGNFQNFTVTIGKDVSLISSSAFAQSPALTGISFEKDYSDKKKIEGRTYPITLTIDNEAFKYCRNLSSIEIPNRTISIGDHAFQEVGNGSDMDINGPKDPDRKFELTFERRNKTDDETVAINCNYALNIDNSAFLDCWYLEDLSLPIRLESLGDNCFKNSIGLKTLVMREEGASYTPAEGHDLLRTIPSCAFHGSAIEELVIPKCVTRIVSGAFGATTNLKKVTFQNNTEYENPEATPKLGKQLFIESGAFSGGREEGRPQLDIYVMVNPNPQGEEAGRKIICEYSAFNYTQTVGQTSVVQNFARLHFPEAAWDYYQGDWKRGLAFRQDNLNAFKDGYTKDNEAPLKDCIGKSSGSISTSTGKYETGDASTLYTPGNGWQEFARTSTAIDVEIPKGSFKRTYSTNNAYIIPTFAEDDGDIKAGAPMFQIFRVTAFSDGFKPGESDAGSASQAQAAKRIATATEVAITDKNELKYIPKETGLLMVGNINANYVVYFADAEFDETHPQTTYPYDKRSGAYTNMLYPTCIDEQNLKGDGTTDQTSETGQPSIVDNKEKVLVNSTIPFPYYDVKDVQFRFFGYSSANNQFLRVKGAKFNRDKAYLKLPADLFHWTSEYNPSDPNSSITNEDPGSARIALNFIDDEEGETTGIKQVNTTLSHTDSNVFYTLEGVRLNSRPTQRGIYIHNGRKIVIK